MCNGGSRRLCWVTATREGGAIGLRLTFDFDSSLRRLQSALASLHADIGEGDAQRVGQRHDFVER